MKIFGLNIGNNSETVWAGERLDIVVDGGYKPNKIRFDKNKKVTLRFIRKSPNMCLEEIVFPDYKIKKSLPVGKAVEVILAPPHPKVSVFHCGMNMYKGKLESIS